jgi:sterol desaturase/sphingolipid hydroxylase (fatty acid hydroxylase superfamily)
VAGEILSSQLQLFAQFVSTNCAAVLAYPVDPTQRIFWLYLLTSVGFAGFAYTAQRRGAGGDLGLGSFWRFCFPREVWRHPSAWLDVRYFFVHQIVRVWIYGGLSVGIALGSADLVSEALIGIGGAPHAPSRPVGLADRALITLVTIAGVDFASYAVHYLQHRVPLLWEFHRVHHSLPVMHPLSNYREHWIDNLFYALVTGVAVGALAGGSTHLHGREIASIDVLGINAFVFLFNALGYNLRHSHVWVAWPSWLGYVLGSPAYHQIHHSYDPRHIDRNFAFLFPVWDWLFDTLYMPRERERLHFGLGDGSEGEYDSVLRLYFLPFARLAQRWRQQPG